LFTLRRLLGTTHPPRSDEQIAEEVARRLTSGAWVARRRRSARFSMSGLEQAEAGPAFPTEGRRSATPQRVSGPAPDLPLFPDDIDPAVIANAQKRAAALGIPFCEECLRAQLANR
jgi:hypothetical protein